jgi:hypothetical protein
MSSLTSSCEDFYLERDRRTSSYLGAPLASSQPVHVAIGKDAAATGAGQLAALALINQLARVHRHVSISINGAELPLAAPAIVQASSFGGSLLAIAQAIDPCGNFRLADSPPSGAVRIGLGAELASDGHWFIGADRALGILSAAPVGFSLSPSSVRGAALASCLGAAAVLRTTLGLSSIPRTVSAWNYAEGRDAAAGPEDMSPVDLGKVLMVGAGAVGASMVYWLHAFGVLGANWAILDRDTVAVHNLNRGMLFTAASAGWPEGNPYNKAELASRFLPGSTPYPHWYDEVNDLASQDFDVVLALANDRNVRYSLAHRNAVVSLQATTGENWQSQLHRHVSGRDDCIACRTGEIRQPVFGCSKGIVPSPLGESSDAALPFLSAASGLMIATALQRLGNGDLAAVASNSWRWDFDSPHRFSATPSRYNCHEGCSIIWPASVRRQMHTGTRWGHLDPATTAGT